VAAAVLAVLPVVPAAVVEQFRLAVAHRAVERLVVLLPFKLVC
jgi:hypothetical protein